MVATLTPAQLPAVLYECGAKCFGHEQGPGVREWQVPHRDALRDLARNRVAALAQFRADGSLQSRRRLQQARKDHRAAVRRMVTWSMTGGLNKRRPWLMQPPGTTLRPSSLVSGIVSALGALPKQIIPHSADGFGQRLSILNVCSTSLVKSTGLLSMRFWTTLFLQRGPRPAWAQWRRPSSVLKIAAPGPDGVPAELYKHSSVRRIVAEVLYRHVCAWWNGLLQSRPGDWRDSYMVALYKHKGDVADLDNWRGICLLPVLSKVMATLVNDSLRSLAENVLAESQVGFRRYRGCADATYVLRHLMEEVRLTTPPPAAAAAGPPPGLYVLFVDLRKAFDSMPRSIMWRTLARLGVPDGLVRCVRDMHEGMKSRVKYRGHLSAAFDMGTGVRKGAVEAPTLWDLCYHYVVLDWRQRLGANSGLDVAFLEDTDLFRTRVGVLGSQDARQMHISELAYADDLATLHLSWSGLCRAAQLLSDTVRDWGGELNVGKTKWKTHGLPCCGQKRTALGRRKLDSATWSSSPSPTLVVWLDT